MALSCCTHRPARFTLISWILIVQVNRCVRNSTCAQMWKLAVPWLAFVASAIIIVVQRTTITNLQRQLATTVRTKRSTDLQNDVFLPVYAQISRKAMHRMCLQKRYTIADMEDVEKTTVMTSPRKKPHARVRSERKRCSSEVNLSDPKLVGVRPNSMGAALRDRHAYYITEFDLGYSMLVFPSSRSLNNSEPKSIITLPYPFHGTDNTVLNGTAYYNYGDMLIAYNIKTGETKELRLNISATMLYNNSNSRLDIQADEHGIWALYRRKGEDYLTASRIQPTSLKVLSSWPLPAVLPSRLCNAFIRCGLLYTVECDVDHVTVAAVYDFYAHMYVNGKQTVWKGLNTLSSVQYDPNSKSITIFDNGNIYSVSAS
ncbi:hypothetical protein Y032_0419g1130 [Ancylostoma ceylanicum]|uniref:Olfactomedin-like domain-containing protein n=1 Tax=Ancylostoma ceylanicum TaxID=53326 RepID=A0A016X1C1_9BILA|nr:hypothetical protein Y032_0419g1130 [Ancylostoma ceylanicum]